MIKNMRKIVEEGYEKGDSTSIFILCVSQIH